MKKVMVFMLAVFMGQLVFAQDAKPAEMNKTGEREMPGGKGRHKMHKHEKREMMKQLNLSEEQKTKLKEMNAGNKEKKQAILNDTKLTEEQKKEQLRAIKKEQATNMQTVLTDEQKAKMKEVRLKMKEERKNRKGIKTKKAETEAKATEAAPAQQNQ